MWSMLEPRDEPNPWRRHLEAKEYIEEALRLLGHGWRGSIRIDLDRAAEAIEYSIDAAGYNSWEYARPLSGRHERDSSWPGRHSKIPVATTT